MPTDALDGLSVIVGTTVKLPEADFEPPSVACIVLAPAIVPSGTAIVALNDPVLSVVMALGTVAIDVPPNVILTVEVGVNPYPETLTD